MSKGSARILAGLIALAVGLFATVVIGGLIWMPIATMARHEWAEPIMTGLRLIIFGIIAIVVFREMVEKFTAES